MRRILSLKGNGGERLGKEKGEREKEKRKKKERSGEERAKVEERTGTGEDDGTNGAGGWPAGVHFFNKEMTLHRKKNALNRISPFGRFSLAFLS